MLAIAAGAARVNAQTPDENPPPLDNYQETQEKLCREQPISEPRTYNFRPLERPPRKDGFYGLKPWYRKLFPFFKTPLEKYGLDDVRAMRADFGRPVPIGETDRSKKIRLQAEQKLAEIEQQGKQQWLQWLRQNPEAGSEEKTKAEIRLHFQGLAAARLPTFDWREYGLDVGAVGDQGFCNTCWAFAAVDAMQASRQLAAMRAQTNDFYTSRRPSVRQLVSCMREEKDYCEIGPFGAAFTYMVDRGLPLGGTTRYVPDKMGYVCDPDTYVKALTWDYVSSSPHKFASTEEIKRKIILYGPVISAVVFDNCFRLYSRGVFNEEQKRKAGGHIVLIIGWDDAKKAWLIKNSYGKGWGEDGFGWIKYGSNNIGQFSAFVVADPKEEARIAGELNKEKK